MNKLVYSGLALTLVSASAFATDTGWVSLDQEINSLNASLSAQNATGPKIGGWFQARWENSSDIQVGGEDLQGFGVDNVRVELTGDAGSDYSYKVSFDFAGGGYPNGTLKDAYAKFKIGDQVTGKLGLFKSNFFRSSIVADNKTVLLDRTGLGNIGFWNSRDWGVEFAGNFDTIGWSLSAQNGGDGQAKEYKFCAKVSANLMGGGVGKVEGAYGAGDETALTGGLAWMDDGSIDDGTVMGVEVAVTSGPFAIHAEMADFDKGTAGAFGQALSYGAQGALAVGTDVADTTPWDVTASYLFTDAWEAALRFQDADDTNDTTAMTVGVNYFVAGHDIKWMAQWEQLKTDAAGGDISLICLGLSVSM